MSEQAELRFDGGPEAGGLAAWRAARQQAARSLALRLGLPLNHQVEVWLRGGVRLRGLLRLEEEVLFPDQECANALALVVEQVVFTPAEIESCVRLD
jgi:hypothetical protein